ncbi:TPA: hypothetical protein DIC21_01440, partial [Candidatus Uhrbacteria bacterium]|nr:hypothetical protein [Candidatus Uhrbacteria bacterium]
DILKDALGAIQERAQAEKVLNLQTVWGDLEHEQGTKDIPEASVDLVSLVSLSGILFKKPTVIKNIKRVLKDGGCLLLVDWQPGSFLSKFLSTHQIDPKKLKNELEKNGFFLVKSFSAGLNHFGLLLQKT